LYDRFVTRARAAAVPVVTGQFQARMRVALINDGPVTLLLDTAERGR
jgi:D-tyrosyl-tRNA(Tyr) deacylase